MLEKASTHALFDSYRRRPADHDGATRPLQSIVLLLPPGRVPHPLRFLQRVGLPIADRSGFRIEIQVGSDPRSSAPKGRKNAAHGASRGFQVGNAQAPTGRKIGFSRTLFAPASLPMTCQQPPSQARIRIVLVSQPHASTRNPEIHIAAQIPRRSRHHHRPRSRTRRHHRRHVRITDHTKLRSRNAAC